MLILTLILGLLFGWGLGQRALWHPDEGRYVEIPREMTVSGDYVTPRLNGVKYFEKPVLFYWLQAGAIKVFGISESAMRLWPAAFALIGCLAVYVAGRKLYDRRTGLIAAAVLATAPLHYFLGRAITLDMALSALLTVALLAFLLGTREPPGRARRHYFWTFYACAALATLTKGLVGMVIPAMVIGAWILILNEWRLLKSIYLPSGLVLFLLVAAPWHIAAARANPEFAQFYFIHEHFQRYLTRVHDRYQPACADGDYRCKPNRHSTDRRRAARGGQRAEAHGHRRLALLPGRQRRLGPRPSRGAGDDRGIRRLSVTVLRPSRARAGADPERISRRRPHRLPAFPAERHPRQSPARRRGRRGRRGAGEVLGNARFAF